jgi:acyl carrier protein
MPDATHIPGTTDPTPETTLMNDAQIIDRTRAYVVENFLYMRPDFQLGETDSLLERGIIDSMGVMELVSFIESEFGVTVGDDDVTEENIGSLRAIGGFVSARAPRGQMVA